MKIGLLTLAAELVKNNTFKNINKVMDMGNKSIRTSYIDLIYLFEQCDLKYDKKNFNFLKKFPKGKRKSTKLFWEVLGINKYNCIDLNGEDNAIKFDLNNPYEDKKHLSKYDLVLDIGNNEHVFNVGEAYRTMYNLCKLNGFMWIFQSVYNGNGFFNYDIPFFEGFALANKLGIIYSAYVISTSDYDQYLVPANKDIFNVIDLSKVRAVDITYIFRKSSNEKFCYYNQYQYNKNIKYYNISFLHNRFPPERYYIPSTIKENNYSSKDNKYVKEWFRRIAQNKK